jgi:hypothetical protein
LKHHAVLGPLEIAVAVCTLRARINSASFSDPRSTLRYLDLSGMSVDEQEKLRSTVLLGTGLEIIEVSEAMMMRFVGLERLWTAVGWECINEGHRCWFQRTS